MVYVKGLGNGVVEDKRSGMGASARNDRESLEEEMVLAEGFGEVVAEFRVDGGDEYFHRALREGKNLSKFYLIGNYKFE
jgi:hypothetical protein